MKIKVFLSIFAMIGFIVLELGNMTIEANGAPDLIKIASVLDNEPILLKSWSLYSREKLEPVQSRGDLEDYVEDFQAKLPGWEWSVTSTTEKWEAIAIAPASTKRKETLQIISTSTPHNANAYIIYKVTGREWNKDAVTFFNEGEFQTRFNDIFRGNPPIFSCVEGIYGDKIKKSLSETASTMLTLFDARETESLRENGFISMSANSPLFAESIKSKVDEMNVQIAVRRGTDGETIVTVGTPIITVEY